MSKKSTIPTFFTGKQIKSIIFDRMGSDIIDQELADFSKSFYHRLAKANTARTTFEREQDSRRLDAMARLLVGDETCAAVAFNGTNLLIATNENTHSKDKLNFKINFLMRGDKYHTDQYQFFPVIYISLNEGIPTKVIVNKPITYYYRKRDDSFNLTQDSPRTIDAILTPAQHLLPNLPDLPVGAHIAVKSNIPLAELVILEASVSHSKLSRYNFIKQNLASQPNKEIEHEGMSKSIPLNGLQRRAEILVEHLATISLIAKNVGQMNRSEEEIEQYKTLADNNRQRVLMNSLSWEASKWYVNEFHPRGYVDSGKTDIDKFLEKLNKNFNEFKVANKSLGKVILVENWIIQVIEKISSGEIKSPEYIKRKIDTFTDKAKRYFIDLAKLEDFFETEAPKKIQINRIIYTTSLSPVG